jgi:pantoate--beta-alanine ligase
MSNTAGRPCLIRRLAELRDTLRQVRSERRRIGLIPTMGALHEGHLSLVRAAQAECHLTLATIFVNPSQFGPHEDFRRYPRTLEADVEKLGAIGTDLLFAPEVDEVYPAGYASWVEVDGMTGSLEGACRPEHFRGVATIVLKLFLMTGADAAFFGQKDFQQALVIRRMVEDLNVPIAVRVCPIVREPDGLAMSSRNAYLSADERRRAAALWESLTTARRMVASGERDAAAIVAAMRETILAGAPTRIDYAALADPNTLEPAARVDGPTVALVAVVIGATRLIDNCILEPAAAQGRTNAP